jgi:hypothetical protein
MQKQNIDSSKIRSILVPVSLDGVPANGVKDFSLGSVAQLRDCVGLISAEVFNTTLQSKDPAGNTNLPDAAWKTSYLSIFGSDNTEVRAQIPCAKLIRSNGNSTIEKLNIFGNDKQPRPIDPQRSKLTIGDCSLVGGATVALIEFVYVAP